MHRRSVCTMMLGALALTGCTSGSTPTVPEMDAPSRAHALWQNRTPYVGDNSEVAALTANAGFGGMGTHTIALYTTSRPYVATVAYDSLSKPFDTVDFTTPVTLLLGTVANLDRVEVRSGTDTFSLTSEEASAKLGFDVKDLGRDEAKLTAYLQSVDD
ncbi:DUF4825 domain-containing protein [Humibacillus xanthopallidus]|uniref:Uncharacterized protein DUF4825 n=1 Tax=Humibacillus xanthopallidus TaxID=412689 RepID=A0A543I2N2_9MICO|nr:DUF4825 domain-containing protein [Humibacillus xanthopallidus]TQM64845.1 uncharacterized protein DUF4825 [Humibacillus xanthopallidus]